MNIKKIKINFVLVGLFIVFALFNFESAFAQGATIEDEALGKASQLAQRTGVSEYSDLAVLAGSAIKGSLAVVGLLFFGLAFYGGYIWMLARGNEEMITKGRKTIIASAIGLVIVLISYTVTILLSGLV